MNVVNACFVVALVFAGISFTQSQVVVFTDFYFLGLRMCEDYTC